MRADQEHDLCRAKAGLLHEERQDVITKPVKTVRKYLTGNSQGQRSDSGVLLAGSVAAILAYTCCLAK